VTIERMLLVNTLVLDHLTRAADQNYSFGIWFQARKADS